MRNVALVMAALVLGLFGGFLLRGPSLRTIHLSTCDGTPIALEPHGDPASIELFVAGFADKGPVDLRLYDSEELVEQAALTPRTPRNAIEFARLGDWYSPATLRLTGKHCQILIRYRL